MTFECTVACVRFVTKHLLLNTKTNLGVFEINHVNCRLEKTHSKQYELNSCKTSFHILITFLKIQDFYGRNKFVMYIAYIAIELKYRL